MDSQMPGPSPALRQLPAALDAGILACTSEAQRAPRFAPKITGQ